MKLLYFAWVREKTGIGEETITMPKGVTTVEDLVSWMITRGGGVEAAFADKSTVRVAVNQEYAKIDWPVTDDDEIAFFPPVTGG